ncbi:hypothetical protein D9M70_587430 [compost metagenome]
MLGVDVFEVTSQSGLGQLSDGACHLHPSRAGTDHDKGEEGLNLGWVVAALRHFKVAEQALTNGDRILERLQHRRVFAPALVAEEAVVGASGEHEIIVWQIFP